MSEHGKRPRWVVYGRTRGLVSVRVQHAVFVAVPGVGEQWWPIQRVREATWFESLLGELELGVLGMPGML